jgi:hypothetical protein
VRVAGDSARQHERAPTTQREGLMAITTTLESARQVALDSIHVPDNVRALDAEHVKSIAGSIELHGMLVPIVVRTDGVKFELVAGFHRVAAARSSV